MLVLVLVLVLVFPRLSARATAMGAVASAPVPISAFAPERGGVVDEQEQVVVSVGWVLVGGGARSVLTRS